MNAREAIGLLHGVAVGAALIFLAFAAIFNGLWALLLVFAVSYGIAAALVVRFSRARPLFVAAALVCPALPWLCWLFPASLPEAGLLRASLWPVAVGVMFLLAWSGGALAARYSPERGSTVPLEEGPWRAS